MSLAVNVTSYGADPTGEEDSSDAFNAAIATGKIVEFEGAFLVSRVVFTNCPAHLVGAGNHISEFYSRSLLLVPPGRSGLRVAIGGQFAAMRNFTIAAQGRDLRTGVGNAYAASHWLQMTAGSGNFDVDDDIRIHGAGWESPDLRCAANVEEGSPIVTIEPYVHGLSVGQRMRIPGFSGTVVVLDIDQADLRRVTVSAPATSSHDRARYTWFDDHFTRVVGRDGDWLQLLSVPEVEHIGAVVEHADHGITLNANATVDEVSVLGFQGNGIEAHGSHGDTEYTNCCCFRVARAFVKQCHHGINIQGIDSSAGKVDQISGVGNRGYVVNDSSFLGCYTSAPHAAPYGVDHQPFRGYRTRHNPYHQSTIVAGYVEDGSHVSTGGSTTVVGGTMPRHPGGPAMGAGLLNRLAIGDASDFSEVERQYQPFGPDDATVERTRARGRAYHYNRRTHSGDGAEGFFMRCVDSQPRYVTDVTACDDAPAPFVKGDLWHPHRRWIGGWNANGTLSHAAAVLETADGGAPPETARLGDVHIATHPLPGEPERWRCVVPSGVDPLTGAPVPATWAVAARLETT